MDEQLVVFTRARVADLAGVRQSRLNYWERTELVRPTVSERLTPRRAVRLYDFQDMMSVLIIAELRGQQISLQHIRQIVSHLRERAFKVSEVVFAIAGRRVHFQTPDGKWEDTVQRGQIVLHQVLKLAPLRARVERAADRDPETVGQIERRRGAHGSKPLIAGTRVPVASVRAFLDDGADIGAILAAYPSLEPADVEQVKQAALA